MIRRFRCQNCRSYHNELPDCLVPYKHYEAEVIAGVLDEVILPDDLDSEVQILLERYAYSEISGTFILI